MERSVREFCSAAERLFAGRARRGACYPEPLKNLALEALRAASEQGLSIKAVARELGVHPETLRGWREASRCETALVPVRVVDAKAENDARLVVVTPSGLRIEGLDVANLAELIRRLA